MSMELPYLDGADKDLARSLAQAANLLAVVDAVVAASRLLRGELTGVKVDAAGGAGGAEAGESGEQDDGGLHFDGDVSGFC
jgi:hypothetical protein